MMKFHSHTTSGDPCARALHLVRKPQIIYFL